MKIGLEFEGVIRNYSTGEITRWPKISDKIRSNIKKIMYVGREKVEPIDGYDCLAEVRTTPISNPNPYDLLNALFTEMENASRTFVAHGYYIQWYEQPIPKELHEEIKHDLSFANDGKKSKYTQTFKDGQVVQYESEGNLFRGGGLHINISSIPEVLAPGLVMYLDKRLRPETDRYKFQSHYRTNVLFRTRIDLNTITNNTYDHIVEYMSHGFNVPKLSGWREQYEECKKNTHFGVSPANTYHLLWADRLITVIKDFVNATKGIK
jgi:hypothetical protein